MSIDGVERMGNWGKKIPTDLPDVHITQTNADSRDGEGVHVTTNISGTAGKVNDRFDENGNYAGSYFGRR
ncbi:MAG: hypothetical protein WCK89_05505 [bacterium]